MTKLRINKKQYNTILLREQQSRLNETNKKQTEPLKNGTKEVGLCVAMMLGFNLTGKNKVDADNAIKNKDIMSQIKSTLEDADKTNELITFLEAKGMDNPSTKLANKANDILKKYNMIASDNKFEDKLGIEMLMNLHLLKPKLA